RLQHDAYALAQGAAVRRGILAQHRHLSRAALAVALEDLHRGRLAGPVGPEQPEHLAALHRDVDRPHGLEGAVALAQTADLDRRARRGGIAHRRVSLTPDAACYQCTPLVRVAIAICSNDARSSSAFSPLAAAESGNTRLARCRRLSSVFG